MIAKGGSREGLHIHSDDDIVTIAVPASWVGCKFLRYETDSLESYIRNGDSYELAEVLPFPVKEQEDEISSDERHALPVQAGASA